MHDPQITGPTSAICSSPKSVQPTGAQALDSFIPYATCSNPPRQTQQPSVSRRTRQDMLADRALEILNAEHDAKMKCLEEEHEMKMRYLEEEHKAKMAIYEKKLRESNS